MDPRNIWPPGYNISVTAGPFLKYLISRYTTLRVRMAEKETTKETTKDLEEENVLDLTIEYLLKQQYPPGLSKNKKDLLEKKLLLLLLRLVKYS